MRDITLCHPRLQLLAGQLVEECSRQGLSIKIGETLRTKEEQDALYAQGRTRPGAIVTNAPGSSYSSYHQWGTAFDFFRNDGKGAYNEEGRFFDQVDQARGQKGQAQRAPGHRVTDGQIALHDVHCAGAGRHGKQ